MYIRIRSILVIFITTLVIISFSILVGFFTVKSGIESSQKADLMLISDIADHFISSEIKTLKLMASRSALWLSTHEEAQWQNALNELDLRHDETIGMAIWNNRRELIAEAGELPAPVEVLDNEYVQGAFLRRETISGTILLSEGHVVFCLSVPIPEMNNAILVMTLPYTFFVDLVSTFVIWETGHIFIDDASGIVVSNPRPIWVERMIDPISGTVMDQENMDIFAAIRQRQELNPRWVTYSVNGVPRICVYRPVSGSDEGWSFGTVAPLTESPFRYINNGLIAVGIVSLFLSLIAAIIASVFIKKPFEKIAAMKEEAEANSKFKSDFLAIMSHEIRTPMNTILGVAEILLRDEKAAQSVTEGLNRIYSSGDLLLNIINDILDLSKIEAGKLEITPSSYETASLINDTVALNMMRLAGKELEFNVVVDENIPQTLLGDEVRIRQILNNLLSNAFKYTEKGEVKLSFMAEADKTGSESIVNLVFSVSDTGQGMSEEELNKLFEKYARFNIEANRKIEGTGLGMSITQNLIGLMNGGITVESKSGKGTVFTVTLPQERIGREMLGRELADNLQNFRLSGTRHISKTQVVYEPMPYGSVLFVDDVESNLYVARGLMIPWEIPVDTVTSGFEAIERIKSGRVYDIVFMDHMMPVMDGMEAVRIIRELGYAHPVVALTANAVKGQEEMFLERGFDDFISKPIDIRRLSTVLKKYIRDKHHQEDAAGTSRNMDSGIRETEHVDQQLSEYFIKDAQRVSVVLETMQEKNGDYDDKDLRLFTVSIHAMKSALANVGEIDLSAVAEKLEKAGDNRESSFISDAIPDFLAELRKIMEKLSSQTSGHEGSGLTVEDYENLRSELLAIKTACDAYDRKTVKDKIVELRKIKWSLPVDELLGKMLEYLLSGDFNGVLKTADRIIDNI